MKFDKFIIGLISLFGFIIIASSSFFILNQAEQAIVLQFGESKKVYTEPGLKFKIPFIQEVLYYDRRIVDYDLPFIYITTEDQKRLVVNAYARYRIKDPLMFFRSIQPATELGIQARLEALISSTVRNVLGSVSLRSMLSEKRSLVMSRILEGVKELTNPLGLEIIDVRIIRAELPKENREAVFARMNAELFKFAKENRAKGEELAQEIKSTAEKEKDFLLAEAEKNKQIIMGEGDYEAIKLSNEVYGKDINFYNFYRSMVIYSDTLSKKTDLVLSIDSQFLLKTLTKTEK